MYRVLRKYFSYNTLMQYGFNTLKQQAIFEWENKLNRNLSSHYCNITHEFIVDLNQVKFELVLPTYSMKR